MKYWLSISKLVQVQEKLTSMRETKVVMIHFYFIEQLRLEGISCNCNCNCNKDLKTFWKLRAWPSSVVCALYQRRLAMQAINKPVPTQVNESGQSSRNWARSEKLCILKFNEDPFKVKKVVKMFCKTALLWKKLG